ncbi:5-hydroxytryptamine receptor 1a [Plakobranchus ocellatus]|uniref:5-hydroxytryptamine receptor 1a n=1 Tax=Plakobranchus ocellatus TaxID=259542 RepID=A0AAV4DSY8_9GAST|nr:5-hydroxytryptamine receptor 1a [Plakobranchus ocellatus]
MKTDPSVGQTPASQMNLSITTLAELEIESTVDGVSRLGVCTEKDLVSSDVLSYFIILVGVTLLCENLLLIYVICRTRSLHSITNILVASMGLTDVLVGVQCCIGGLVSRPNGLRSWLDLTHSDLHTFDSVMISLSIGLVSISILHVTVLAVDRYLYILWPFDYTRRVTRSRVLLTAGGIWMLGLSFVLSLTLQFQKEKYRTICIISQTPVAFIYWPFFVIYFLCLIIVFTCTFGITKIAVDHGRRRKMRMLAQARASAINWQSDANNGNGSVYDIHSINSRGADRATKKDPNKNDNLCDADQNKDHVKASIVSMILESSLNKFATDLQFPPFVGLEYGAMFYTVQAGHCSGHSDFVKTETLANLCRETNVQNISPEVVPKASNMPYSDGFEAASTVVSNHLKTVKNETSSNKNFYGTNKHIENAHKVLHLSPAEPNNKNKEMDGSFHTENLKIIKFIIIIFGSFFICTFPSMLFIIIVKIMKIPVVSDNTIELMQFPIVSNSGMNFFIITYMNKDFRAALAQRLPCCKVFCTVRES